MKQIVPAVAMVSIPAPTLALDSRCCRNGHQLLGRVGQSIGGFSWWLVGATAFRTKARHAAESGANTSTVYLRGLDALCFVLLAAVSTQYPAKLTLY